MRLPHVVEMRMRLPLSLLMTSTVVALAAMTMIGSPAFAAHPMPFSAGPAGATAPAGWSVETLPKVKRVTRFDLIREGNSIVLRARSDAAAASLRHAVFADPAGTPLLHWRWRTDHVLQTADMTTKEGDDFAARLYVFFDRNEEQMTMKERTLLKLGRTRYGDQLPAAALCYVWDNKQPVDTLQDSPYTSFVKVIVASSGTAQQGQWLSLQRDIAADYRRAFGTEPPTVTGVAVSVDTDNTAESTVTYFGDIRFDARQEQHHEQRNEQHNDTKRKSNTQRRRR